MSATLTTEPTVETLAALADWPEATRVGYVVRSADDELVRVSVGTDGRLDVEGLGTFEVLEEVRVAEHRAGLAAFAAGRI